MNQSQGSLFSKLLVPLIIVVIVVYLIASAWAGLRNPYQFTVAYADTMETSVTTSGWVVRSEQTVSGAEGVVQLLRNQGEKVGKGQAIAMVYQSETDVESQAELIQLEEDLEALQYATNAESPSGTVLDSQILSAMSSLRNASSTGDYSGLATQTANYRQLVLRREYLLSSEANAAMTQAATDLQARYDALAGDQSGATAITAEESGLFSSYVDGYENLLNPDKLEGLSPKDLAAFSQLTPETEANTLGKLVTDSVWYYAVTVSGDTVSLFETGDSVDVFFDALSETLPMTVYSVGEIQNGEMVVVFRSSQNDSKVEDLRQESGRLIFQSDEGLRIPKEALRVNEDGETGVYVVLAQKARFRPVTVLAEDTDSYLVQETRSSWLPRNYMMERWYVDTMTETKSYETIAANVAAVREHMRQAALAAGRNPEDITLVAATKVQTSDTIRNAIRAGITICGENRVQELTAHLEDNAYEGARVHFIGHLQTNKVKFVVGKVDMIESIDSVRLMDAVEKQAAKVGVTQDILLEVNIGDEASKGGVQRQDLMALAQHAAQCPHLRLRGLMSIPPATATEEENQGFFQETYQLFVDMKEKLRDNNPNIDCLSMGMSGDYPLAIANGSTMVRVGTALFGARPPWHPQG